MKERGLLLDACLYSKARRCPWSGTLPSVDLRHFSPHSPSRVAQQTNDKSDGGAAGDFSCWRSEMSTY